MTTARERAARARSWYERIHPEHVRLGYLSGNCSICAELRVARDRADDAALEARRKARLLCR